jgi:hypothetical protein
MKLTKRVMGVSALVTGLVSTSANAAAIDLSALTAEIDFSSVSTAVLAVAAALAGIYITWKAASLVLRAIRGL